MAGEIGWLAVGTFALIWLILAEAGKVEFMTHAWERWAKKHPAINIGLAAVWAFIGMHLVVGWPV